MMNREKSTLRRLVTTTMAFAAALTLWAQTTLPQGTLPSEATPDTTIALPWPQRLQLRLDSLTASDPLLERTQMGLMVWDLTADSALFCRDHRQTLRPASTMKLLTAVAALDRFGADHRLRTTLYRTGTIEGRTLRGDLYLMGAMDPAIDATDLDLFVSSIQRLGVDTLKGRLVADLSAKDTLHWGQGWCWDDQNPTLAALMALRRPDFTQQLRQRLTESGVNTDSLVLDGGLTPSEAEYVCAATHSLPSLLHRMMKESDNLYAECVFYLLATDRQPATAMQARAQVRQLISRLGLEPKNYRVADGSGLSLYNYVSAELEVLLLRYAWRQPRIRQTLMESLPIAGVDGTLRRRMKKTAAEGNVRAKTGTLSGVITLAGYCTAPNGHQLCFAMLNQGTLAAADARTLQDKMCVLLCN